MLKISPKINQRQLLMNSWIHNFKPVGNFENKLWQNEHNRRPVVDKITISTKKARVCSITVKIRSQKTKVLHVGFSAILYCTLFWKYMHMYSYKRSRNLGMFITFPTPLFYLKFVCFKLSVSGIFVNVTGYILC